MDDSNQNSANAATLKARADEAVRRNDLRGAAGHLVQATAISPDDPAMWMSLAACRRGLGDPIAALAAIENALRVDPRLFVALLMKATLIEQSGDAGAAGRAYGVALTQTPPADQVGAAMQQAIAHGREVHDRYRKGLEDALRAGAADVRSQCASGEARRADHFIDILTGNRRVYHSEPVQYHYPGLAEVEFFDRADMPWIEAFEAHTPAIVEELLAIQAAGVGEFTPYIEYPPGIPLNQWAELNHSRLWSAFHLMREGLPVEANSTLCPNTMAALACAPQPTVANRSPAAMFSVLSPRTRIPPHTGVANTRLVVHLPLIVPDGCGFRVGGTTRLWRVGEAFAFDDTIEHEAWNDSDEPRTVLICDIWRPDLSEIERALIVEVMKAVDDFGGLAPGPGGL